MNLVDAIIRAGTIPSNDAARATKKSYSETLSRYLAEEVAAGLRSVGFPDVKPDREGVGEKAFQGGLGTKKVDVSYSDEGHGLMLAVSIKTICFPEFGKNLKNRFGDMCTEAITLHMRFPYSVVCGLFAFPVMADLDASRARKVSTFSRATKLFSTISGRRQHTEAPEKFENMTMMLFHPLTETISVPSVKLVEADAENEIEIEQYFSHTLEIFDRRNPYMTM